MSYLLLASSGADSADDLWHYRVTIKDRALIQWDAQVGIISGSEITDQWDSTVRIKNRTDDLYHARISLESGELASWDARARVKDTTTDLYHVRAAVKSSATGNWHGRVSLGQFATASYDGLAVLVRTVTVPPIPGRIFYAPTRRRTFSARPGGRRR